MASEGAAQKPPAPGSSCRLPQAFAAQEFGASGPGKGDTARGTAQKATKRKNDSAGGERVLGVVGACPVLPGPLSPWDTPKPVLPPAPSSSLAGRVGQRLRGAGAGSGSCCSPEELEGSKSPRGRQLERWRGQDWVARPCGGGVPVLLTPALGARGQQQSPPCPGAGAVPKAAVSLGGAASTAEFVLSNRTGSAPKPSRPQPTAPTRWRGSWDPAPVPGGRRWLGWRRVPLPALRGGRVHPRLPGGAGVVQPLTPRHARRSPPC